MTREHWHALGVVGAGAVSISILLFWASGRRHEAAALGVATGIVSTAFAAARVLNSGGGPATAPGGYGMPG